MVFDPHKKVAKWKIKFLMQRTTGRKAIGKSIPVLSIDIPSYIEQIKNENA